MTETTSAREEVGDKRLTQNNFKPRADDTRFRIMSLKCHRMHHMCSYSMMFVQLHISIFYKFSKVTHTNLVTGSSVTKLEPFQVVAIFSSSLDLILTVAVSSSVFLSAQTTPKECNFASPPWQGTGVGDSQVTPAVAESL